VIITIPLLTLAVDLSEESAKCWYVKKEKMAEGTGRLMI
jgi:hypothetical protein